MNLGDAHELELFFENVPFPIERDALVEEALESHLPSSIRDAIALLPDHEYRSKEEVTHELLGSPVLEDDTPKKDSDTLALEEADDKMDSLVNLDEFTQMGDEEDHESI
jgi:hypothetical protein